MQVVEVADGSADFDAVLKLWRTESDTLGHLPKGGFSDAARARSLFAAKDASGIVVGYVLFRRSVRRGDTSITHLCVAPTSRGKRVAEVLFEDMRKRCCDSSDIRLKCRRDFEHANRLWQRLGFTAVTDTRGRGRDGTLTTWRYPLVELPLLQRLAEIRDGKDDRIEAVIDANVFFDLDDLRPGREESRALVADWLDDFVSLSVTEELLNEINRCPDHQDRDRHRRRAAAFKLVARDTTREGAFISAIEQVLPCCSENQRSDVRQLAMAAAADAPFFVTRDTDFLAAADALENIAHVRIVQPFELVLRFDELRRESEYRPARLFLGPGVTTSLARQDDVERIASLMHDGQPAPEALRRTRARLRDFLAAPERFEVRRICHGQDLLAAYVVERESGVLRVPFFAVQNSALGRTAARHWVDSLLGVAMREARTVVRFEDPTGRRVSDALTELGFEPNAGGWLKIGLRAIGMPSELATEVEAVVAVEPSASSHAALLARELRLLACDDPASRARCAAIECALWPVKVTGGHVPTFIVPIQPRWAQHLFDVGLASGTLFGANPSLVLNCENVYYRAPLPAVLSAPARVLWYVSQDPAYPDAMAIRACSQLDEVLVGPAKDLFRRFERLGVYRWSDVSATADGDPSKDIMAFRFTKTELFRRPLSWNDLQDLLVAETGRRSPLASPVRVPESFFVAAYRRGLLDA